MERKLNCREANELSITGYLAGLGYRPEYIRGADYWYLSPLREETQPSFKVNDRLNAWYDHGLGEGGSLIDLGLRLHQCSIPELLDKFSEGRYAFSVHQPARLPASANEKESSVRILQVGDLQSPGLLAYLHKRGGDQQVATSYCREVTFSIRDKQYTAIGFKNRSGGYELRNTWFKGSSSPKDITLIGKGSSSLCVLEGFMDFLSLLSIRSKPDVGTDFLILNSLTGLSRSMEFLENRKNIFLMLDHDPPGQTARDRLLNSGLPVTDASGFYQGYKDINEYLIATRSTRQQKVLRAEHRPGRYPSISKTFR